MAQPVPHDQIRELRDRSWTERLLALAIDPSTPDDERGDAFTSLEALGDHRAVAPLIALLEDRGQDPDLRRAASDVLGAVDDTSTLAQRSAWWHEGDELLRAHALGQMGRSESGIVAAVAADPRHPLQAQALEALSFDFGEPAFASILIDALAHPDADVRFAAADALVWDEPAAAEEALLRAAGDEDPRVAEAALFALSYYPTRRALRALSEASLIDDEDVRDQADDTIDDLRAAFAAVADAHDPQERMRARAWMAPVEDLVDWTEDESELDGEPARWTPSPRTLLPVAAHEIQAMLADPEGQWTERMSLLRQVDWASHGPQEREALRRELVAHPDPDLRAIAMAALGAWGDRDLLVIALLDDSATVRQLATHHLGKLPPDPALAPILWARLEGTAGLPAEEALKAHASHAGNEEAREALVGLALASATPEALRRGAVSWLADAGASEEIERLLPLLLQPPSLTWGLHQHLLEAVKQLELPTPPLGGLEAVDHLEVHAAVAELLARDASRDAA